MKTDSTTIVITKKYDEVFKSVASLIQNGCAFDGLSYDKPSKTIFDSNSGNKYVFDPESSGLGEDVEQLTIRKDGASWFSSLRGKKAYEDPESVWQSFISQIAIGYHRKFSFIEYDLTNKADTRVSDKAKDRINAINNVLFRKFGAKLQPASEKEKGAVEDLFVVNVKVKYEDQKPLIGSLFFRKKGEHLMPIFKDGGEMVQAIIDQEDPDDVDRVLGDAKDDRDFVFEEFKSFLAGCKENGQGNFADYIVYDKRLNKQYKEVHKNLIENAPNQKIIRIACHEISLIGILHVKWKDAIIDYAIDRRPVLQYRISRFGGTERISLYCLCCKEENALIDDNTLAYWTEEGGVSFAPLDFSNTKTLGLDEDVIDSSLVRDHLLKPNCSSYCNSERCSNRFYCRSNEHTMVSGDQNISYCEECPFPFVIYRNKNGIAMPTKNLNFARLSKNGNPDLIESKAVKCAWCGREYEATLIKNAKCSFCNNVERVSEFVNDSDKESEEFVKAKNLYRTYRPILSPYLSLHAVWANHLAFEDNEFIVFTIGKAKYFFDKKAIKDDRYLVYPKKLK